MDIQTLINSDIGYHWSSNNVSISYILKNIEEGRYILTDYDTDKIPLELTVYKILKNMPISIVATAKHADDKIYWNIVKGCNEIRNIIKWINEDTRVTLGNIDASFKSVVDDDNFVLKRFSLISTIIDSDEYDGEKVPTDEELMRIVRIYF